MVQKLTRNTWILVLINKSLFVANKSWSFGSCKNKAIRDCWSDIADVVNLCIRPSNHVSRTGTWSVSVDFLHILTRVVEHVQRNESVDTTFKCECVGVWVRTGPIHAYAHSRIPSSPCRLFIPDICSISILRLDLAKLEDVLTWRYCISTPLLNPNERL